MTDADSAQPLLDERKLRILACLCREYSATGSSVSSLVLRERYDLPWSSATIRAELAALEELGLLFQPHASAGRLPTVQGLRAYVASVRSTWRPSGALLKAVDRGVQDAVGDAQAWMQAAVCLLSDVLGCVAVSFVGRFRSGRFEDVDLVPLVGSRVLAILTLDDGSRTIHPITFDSFGAGGPSPSDTRVLQDLAGRLRWLCRGQTLDDARRRLADMLSRDAAGMDGSVRDAMRVGLSMLSSAALDPLTVCVAGQSALARVPSVTSTVALTQLLRLFDNYHRLADVLQQLLPEQPLGELPQAEVRLCSEPGASAVVELCGADELPGVSVVGCRLPARTDIVPGGREVRALAVVGPDSMDYEAVLPLVEYAARALVTRAQP